MVGWLLLAITGCTNSGLGLDVTPGETGLGTTPVGDTAPEVTENCPWVGIWELADITCGSVPYKDDYDGSFTTTVMTLSHDPASGCAASFTWSGEACQESETWHFGLPTENEVQVTFHGISECSPEACTFDVTNDVPCELGSRAGEAAIPVQEGPDELRFTGLLKAAIPGCAENMGVKSTWTPR